MGGVSILDNEMQIAVVDNRSMLQLATRISEVVVVRDSCEGRGCGAEVWGTAKDCRLYALRLPVLLKIIPFGIVACNVTRSGEGFWYLSFVLPSA